MSPTLERFIEVGLSVTMIPLLVTFTLALFTAWLLVAPHIRQVPDSLGSPGSGEAMSDELVRRELEELQHDLDTGKSTPEDFERFRRSLLEKAKHR